MHFQEHNRLRISSQGGRVCKLCSPPPTKLQLDYRKTIIENQLKMKWTNSCNWIYKKEAIGTGKRGKGAEPTGPTPMVWQLSIKRDISAADISNEEGSQFHTRLPNSGITAEKRSPHMTWQWKTEIMCQRYKCLQEIKELQVLKRPCTDSLTHKPTHCKSQCRNISSKIARTYREELNWLTSGAGLKGKGSGQLSLGMEVLAWVINSFVKLSPTQLALSGRHQICARH